MAGRVAEALPQQEGVPRLTILAGAVGNILEWYDFGAYGFFAATFGRNFFPNSDHIVSLLSAFSVFAAAFFMRPLGGIVFGHIADRFGRGRALTLSSIMMAAATFLIGCLPTYASLGLAAPLLLILLRLLQGLSVGGEYSASITFLAESSKPQRRGLVSSLAAMGGTLGTLLGSCMGMAITLILPPDAVVAWGWRLPFLFGIVLGGCVFWLRRQQMAEPQARPARAAFPLLAAFRADWRAMLRGFLLSGALLAYFYILFVYFVTFASEVDGLAGFSIFTINTTSLLVCVLLVPLFGHLSDRIGRRIMIILGFSGLVLLTWPLFRLFSSHHVELKVLAGQVGLAAVVMIVGAPLPAVLAESMGRTARCSAVAVSYNLGAALGGGLSPLVAAALVNPHDRHPMAPALYLIVWAALALLAALTLPRRQIVDLPA
jgi:MHS family proline/betaine transporter-like MFS transporter